MEFLAFEVSEFHPLVRPGALAGLPSLARACTP
jgi:hypothetical protein